jgi:hypothetical protein
MDPLAQAILRGVHASNARDRIAAVYAYADYHSDASAGPTQLQATPGISAASAEQFLSARYAREGSESAPSRRRTSELYRDMKKAQAKPWGEAIPNMLQ